MTNKLTKYNNKRNFSKTGEPKGIKKKSNKKLRFVVQHHLASHDHYDFRLEWNGVLKSWAVPKGPSYNPKDKRLAVLVEDHPLDYRNFEGTIPLGEYGGGTVMVFDSGYFEPLEDFASSFKKGSLKFILQGSRLKGAWTLINFKNDNWLLIKEKDEYQNYTDLSQYVTSIKTGRTFEEIAANENISKNCIIEGINITNPDKFLYKKSKITKLDVVKYYQKIAPRMFPLIKRRIISTIRCPEGIEQESFFKKHFDEELGLEKIIIPNQTNHKEDYYYLKTKEGLISEAQMNSIEFHMWGSTVDNINNPDLLVFDLDPDEKLSLTKIRQGVRDLKSILDELKLNSYLKTSGGKGYHVVVPLKYKISWSKFRKIAKDIADLMVTKWPDRYVSNMRKSERKGKIFIDWVRNTKSSTSVAPYSLRARANAPVSMPINWNELDKIKPNEITLTEALKRLKRKDPWEGIFD